MDPLEAPLPINARGSAKAAVDSSEKLKKLNLNEEEARNLVEVVDAIIDNRLDSLLID